MPRASRMLSFNSKFLILTPILALAVTFLLLGSNAHAATFTVTNTDTQGPGSLRQAMLDANATPDLDTIEFNIPGPGPHTIQPVYDNPSSPTATIGLPTITSPMILDACTQPGSDCSSDNLQLMVEIDGTYTGTRTVGETTAVPFYFQNAASSGSTVRGFMVNRIQGRSSFPPDTTVEYAAIGNLIGADIADLTIESNILGTDTEGTPDIGNRYGVYLFGVENTTIRNNVIVSSSTEGLSFPTRTTAPFRAASNITVQGNRIGVGVNGESLGNLGGMSFSCSGHNIQIGGSAPGQDNTIANNGQYGVAINSNSTGCDDGNSADSRNISIVGNTIRDNAGVGVLNVLVGASSPPSLGAKGVTIRQNSIYGNGELGIDLSNSGTSGTLLGDGVTPNGPANELREGPNSLVNYPMLYEAEHGSTVVSGVYEGMANETYQLDFYSNETADPSGHGQGQVWIGSEFVTTDDTGVVNFSFSFDVDTLDGHTISATATNSMGSTSEFSGSITMPTSPVDPDPNANDPQSSSNDSTGQLAETGSNPAYVILVSIALLTFGWILLKRHLYCDAPENNSSI